MPAYASNRMQARLRNPAVIVTTARLCGKCTLIHKKQGWILLTPAQRTFFDALPKDVKVGDVEVARRLRLPPAVGQ